MTFDFGRQYDAHLFVGDVAPWSRRVWAEASRALTPIFDGPTKSAVRTGKKLGRLGWRDAAKWTGGSQRAFEYAEIWSPSWNECERTETPPDAFLNLHNPLWSGVKGVVSVSVLACAVDSEVHAYTATAARELARVLDATTHLAKRLAWGGSEHGGSIYSLNIQYVAVSLETDSRTGQLILPKWKRVNRR